MESRAWGAAKKRTNLYVLKLRYEDYLFAAITVGILALAIFVRLYLYIPRLEELLAGTV